MTHPLSNPDGIPPWRDINNGWPELQDGVAGDSSASIDSLVDAGSPSASPASFAPPYTPTPAPSPQAPAAAAAHAHPRTESAHPRTEPNNSYAAPEPGADDANTPAGDVCDISDAVGDSPRSAGSTTKTAAVPPHHYTRLERWLFTIKNRITSQIDAETKKNRHYVLSSPLDRALFAGVNWYLSHADSKISERSYQTALADTDKVITIIDSEIRRLESRIDLLTEESGSLYDQDAGLKVEGEKTLKTVHEYRTELTRLEQEYTTASGRVRTELNREVSKMRGDRIRTQLQYERIHTKRGHIRDIAGKKDSEINRASMRASQLLDDRGCLEAAKEDIMAQHDRLYAGKEDDDASNACYHLEFQQAVVSHVTSMYSFAASYRDAANKQEEADSSFNLRNARPPRAAPAVLKEQQLNRQYVEQFDRRLDQLEQEAREWETP